MKKVTYVWSSLGLFTVVLGPEDQQRGGLGGGILEENLKCVIFWPNYVLFHINLAIRDEHNKD